MTIASLANAYALGSVSTARRSPASTSGSGSPDPTHMSFAEMKSFADQLFKEGKITNEQWSVLTIPVLPAHSPATILEDNTPYNHVEMYRYAMMTAQRSQDYEFMRSLVGKLEQYGAQRPVDIIV